MKIKITNTPTTDKTKIGWLNTNDKLMYSFKHPNWVSELPPQKITRGDKIRTLSNTQLAEYLDKITTCDNCIASELCMNTPNPEEVHCFDIFLNYINEEVTD